MQYVVMKDDASGEVELIGRFGGASNNFVDEILTPEGWEFAPVLESLLFDGQLEDISEEEAKALIARRSKLPERQAA